MRIDGKIVTERGRLESVTVQWHGIDGPLVPGRSARVVGVEVVFFAEEDLPYKSVYTVPTGADGEHVEPTREPVQLLGWRSRPEVDALILRSGVSLPRTIWEAMAVVVESLLPPSKR
jgi:hypothetical protein